MLKFQSLYFWTSLINFSDNFLGTLASYYYYYFSNFFQLYIFIFFSFFMRRPKNGLQHPSRWRLCQYNTCAHSEYSRVLFGHHRMGSNHWSRRSTPKTSSSLELYRYKSGKQLWFLLVPPFFIKWPTNPETKCFPLWTALLWSFSVRLTPLWPSKINNYSGRCCYF
jgi:hypothetical protein